MTPGATAYGAIDDGAIAVRGGKIAWMGPRADLPSREGEVHDLGGAWLTPGLIDCHTHLVFGGDRAGEFEQRLKGATYEEIARAGGGIRSTVAKTRAASEDELVRAGARRLAALMEEGVTTVEIKSGYGLDVENELKMLRAARRLGEIASRHGEDDVPRRACRAAGIPRPAGRLCGARRRPDARCGG